MAFEKLPVIFRTVFLSGLLQEVAIDCNSFMYMVALAIGVSLMDLKLISSAKFPILATVFSASCAEGQIANIRFLH